MNGFLKLLKKININIKIIILAIVFLVVIGLYFILSSDTKSESYETMGNATLPVVYMNYEKERINLLQGYTQNMDSVYMRDSITPLPDDYTINFEIDTYGTKVNEIKYEVRSLDGANLVEKGKIKDYDTQANTLSASVTLDEMLSGDTEYILIITLSTKDYDSINYYTRIINESDSYLDEQINFVNTIHDCTMDKNRSNELISYLEPDSTKNDNTNLGLVTINSNYRQVSWGSLTPELVTEPVITIKEQNGSVGSFQLSYIVAITDNNVEEKYNVTEYYKVNLANNTSYLLDYERTTNQIFKPTESTNVTKSLLNLGIDSTLEADFKADTTGNYICFAQEGDIWCMDTKNNEITSIFSFRNEDFSDVRNNNNQHNIEVVNVDDEGNVEFLVYGYMNRGKHEGGVGVSLYHYSKETNSVEEIIYVPSERPYAILDKSLGKLLYLKDNSILYLMIDDYIYSIDVVGKEYVEVASGLEEGNYSISYDCKKIAWHVNGSVNNANEIRVLNLETGESQTVLAEDGKIVKALGFLGDDFVYGVANTSDLIQDISGNSVLYMNEVRVVNKDNEVEYVQKQEGLYYSGAVNEYNRIILKSAQRSENSFSASADIPVFNLNQEEKAVTSASISSSTSKGKEVIINYINKVTNGSKLKIITSNEIAFNSSNDLAIRNMVSSKEQFYVYAKGKLTNVYENLAEAITTANDQGGLVVDDSQTTIWNKNGRKSAANLTSVEVKPVAETYAHVATSLGALLQYNGVTDIDVNSLLQSGENVLDILNENLDNRGLDLSGCSLNQILYFVNAGQPVIGILSSSEAVLIVGYNASNVILLNLDTGESYESPITAVDAMLAGAGNKFISVKGH